MIRSLLPLWLRLAATFLVVLSIFAAAQARAAMPFAGPLMAIEICHDHTVRTILVDAAGNEHPAAPDCRDCPLCALPALDPARSAPLTAIFLLHTADIALRPDAPRRLPPSNRFPPARGPPSLQSRIASA